MCFNIWGENTDPANAKNLNQYYNFEQISNKFRNFSASNKMHAHYATPSIAPKHVRHTHSQNSLFYSKFAKCAIFLSVITSGIKYALPNWSMIAELFPTKQRNVRPRINNVTTSASNIIIEWSLLTN